MYQISLTSEQVLDLVEVLGAASGVFEHLASDPESKAFRSVSNKYAENAEKLCKAIGEQVNEQNNTPRIKLAK